jgi:predicted DCC family thiol-disulfide oxidoreductase YuxK
MDTADWLDAVEARIEGARSPRSLTILFDPGCALCRRCRAWMLTQPSYLPLRFMACTGPEAQARFGAIPWLGDELVVVGDRGEVWAGAAAFLVCLWALPAWRPWSYRLAAPAFAPLAERFFQLLSSRRRGLAALVDHRCAEGSCTR